MNYLKTTFVCAAMAVSAPAFGPAFATNTKSIGIFSDHARMQPKRNSPLATKELKGEMASAPLAGVPAIDKPTQASIEPISAVGAKGFKSFALPKDKSENTQNGSHTQAQQEIALAYVDQPTATPSIEDRAFAAKAFRTTLPEFTHANDFGTNSNVGRREDTSPLNTSSFAADGSKFVLRPAIDLGSTPLSSVTLVSANFDSQREPPLPGTSVSAQTRPGKVLAPEIDGTQSALAFSLLISLLVIFREIRESRTPKRDS
jgi:hypothetical protein